MSDAVSKLLPVLDAMSDEEREEVRVYLEMFNCPTPTDEEFDAEWGEELDRRLADLEAGRTTSHPAEEVFARIDAKLAAMRKRRDDAG